MKNQLTTNSDEEFINFIGEDVNIDDLNYTLFIKIDKEQKGKKGGSFVPYIYPNAPESFSKYGIF